MSEEKEFTDIEKIKETISYIKNNSKSGNLVKKDDLYKSLSIEEEEELNNLLAAVEEKEDLIILKRILDDSGSEYLYSSIEMTDKYANILMSVKNKNYLKLIADTVRYESKTYPRATRLSLFTISPYNINESALLGLLSSLNANSEYSDLKYTEASNGAKFIYSEKYMTERYARTLAEWEAVLQKENP